MINDSIIFLPEYCKYLEMPSFPIFTILIVNTEIIFIATQKDVLSKQILKKGLMEKIDKSLKILEELLKKKRRLINASKQKINMAKSNHKTVFISILDNSGKENLPISIPETKVSTLNTKKVNIAMIDVNTYWTTCKLKNV